MLETPASARTALNLLFFQGYSQSQILERPQFCGADVSALQGEGSTERDFWHCHLTGVLLNQKFSYWRN